MTERNYRILRLSPQKTVVVERDDEVFDTLVSASNWGLHGIPPNEQKILLRGLTPKQKRMAREP